MIITWYNPQKEIVEVYAVELEVVYEPEKLYIIACLRKEFLFGFRVSHPTPTSDLFISLVQVLACESYIGTGQPNYWIQKISEIEWRYMWKKKIWERRENTSSAHKIGHNL